MRASRASSVKKSARVKARPSKNNPPAAMQKNTARATRVHRKKIRRLQCKKILRATRVHRKKTIEKKNHRTIRKKPFLSVDFLLFIVLNRFFFPDDFLDARDARTLSKIACARQGASAENNSARVTRVRRPKKGDARDARKKKSPCSPGCFRKKTRKMLAVFIVFFGNKNLRF